MTWRTKLFFLSAILAGLVYAPALLAAVCTTSAGTTWNTAGNWSCGHVPLAADSVVINRNFTVNVATANVLSITIATAGITVTQSSAMNTAGTLSLSAGTLTSSAALTAGALTITGGALNSTNTMTINGATSITTGALNINATTGTHVFNGNVDINAAGTWNNAIGEAVTIQGNLSRAATGTFTSGAGTYTFSNAGAWLGSALTFGGAVSITGAGRTSAITVNITGTLAVTNPGTLTNSGTLTVTGNVTVTGTLRNDAGGALTMNGATGITVTGGIFRIEGGAVTVGNAANESVILTSNAATAFLMNGGTLDVAGRITNSAAAGLGSFTLNNGTITVGINGNTLNSALGAPFFIASGMTYTLAGGMIVIQSSNTQANAREYDVNSTVVNSTITGGTVQIGNAATAAGQTFAVDSVPPVPNFTINAANNPGVTLLAALTVNGNWTNNSSGTFTPGGFTVTFGGGAAQTIGGSVATAFAGMTINNAAGVSLSSIDTSASGVLTFSAGNFSTGSNTLTMTAAAPAIVGATTAQHVVGNLAKVFPAAAGTFYLFAVGDGANYSPLTITFPAAPTSGNLTVSVTNEDHRNTTAGTSGINPLLSVNRYWTLKDSTVAGTYDATFAYVAGDNDGGTTPASYRIRRGAGCSGTGVSRTCTPWAALTVSGTPTTTGAVATGAVVAADSPAQADFAIGQLDPSINFLREKQFIYTRELY